MSAICSWTHKMRRWLSIVGITALAAIFGTVVWNPLFLRSENSVQAWALRTVPIGSSVQSLMDVANDRSWRINGVWAGDAPHADWGGISGDKIAWIYLGGYRLILRTDFDSFWAFDENGRLIGVRIRQMTDGP